MDPLRNYRGEGPAAFIDPRGSTWREEDYEKMSMRGLLY